MLAHAKPVIVTGAYLAGKATGNFSQFAPFKPAMAALLGFWERERRDPVSGLHTWFDGLETGSDNVIFWDVPSHYSAGWTPSMANSIAQPDLETLLYREHIAYTKVK